jgi:hypothetical protein
MGRWIVALPLLAAGVSISGGGTPSADPIAGPVAGEFHAQRQPVQAPARRRKSAHALGFQHQLARKPKLPAHDPLLAVRAKARPTVGPPLSDSEEEGILRPHSVNTMRVLASAGSLPATPPGAPSSLERSQDEDRYLENTMVPAGIHDGTKSSPIGLRSPPSPAELTTTELMALLGTCCVAAICVYGLVALNSGRRRPRLGLLRPSRRGCARLPSSKTDPRSDRLAYRRLFPHQFGVAIQDQ